MRFATFLAIGAVAANVANLASALNFGQGSGTSHDVEQKRLDESDGEHWELNPLPRVTDFMRELKDAVVEQRRDPTAEFPDSGTGGHPLQPKLLPEREGGCTLVSYGVRNDYRFEAALERDFGCHGIAFDPTSKYTEATLPGTNITFSKAAAPGHHTEKSWTVVSPAQAAKMQSMEHVSVLKMDCEGCEYALAESLEAAMPAFFDRVDQFTVEFHFANKWLHDERDLQGLEKLLGLLGTAGLKPSKWGVTDSCGWGPGGFDNRMNAYKLAVDAWKSEGTGNSSAVEDEWGPYCYDGLKGVGHMCGINCVNVLFARG